jgi:8-oxo-dGTP pyrophosphatase MutT (NUDIX family)
MAGLAGDSPALPPSPPEFDLASIRRALAPTLLASDPPPGAEAALQAAVALVLRPTTPADGAELLLIRRAERVDDPWSGHMALPGGRRDPRDRSLVHTACRETFEEVGLELDGEADLLGCLPPLPATARGQTLAMTVTAHVFHGPPNAELRVNDEVAEFLWVPLAALRNGSLDTQVEYRLRGPGAPLLKLPAWSVEGRVVWGLTHRMISNFFELLSEGRPRP